MRTRRSSLKALKIPMRRLLSILALLTLALWSLPEGVHAPVAQASGYSDNNNWMASRANYIGAIPLKQLIIPGAHDAGTYGLRDTAWFYGGTQNTDMEIDDMLNHGIRYFDLRAQFYDHGNGIVDYFIYHGRYTSDLRLRDVLDSVNTWAHQPGHEKEVIILDLQVSNPDENNSQQVSSYNTTCQQFMNGVGTALLTPKKIPEGETLYELSLNEIWALENQPRIITNWNGCPGAAGWPQDATTAANEPLDSFYANQCYPSQYYGAYTVKTWPGILGPLPDALQKRGKTVEGDPNGPTSAGEAVTGLYVLFVQATTTYDCAIKLYDLSQPATIEVLKKLGEWYQNNEYNARKNLNIVAGDFVEETSLVNFALNRNFSANFTPEAKTADRQPYTSGSITSQPVTIEYTCSKLGDSGPVGEDFPETLTITLPPGSPGSNVVVSQSLRESSTLTATITVAPESIRSDSAVVKATCVDFGGREYRRVFTVNFQGPPSITPQVAPAIPNGQNDWYTANTVQVTWIVEDNGSPISSSGCGPTSIVADTTGTTLTCTATNAGGTVSNAVTIKRDATAPTIDASAKSANGSTYTPDTWTNQAVTVQFTCTDSTSGLATVCPAGQTISAEGVKPTIPDISVTDNAGNTGSLDFGPIKIDTTKPTIAGQAAPAPNANGWNNSDVKVTFTCEDSLSKIATCSPQQVLIADGAAQSATGMAVDNASNSGTTTVSGINIDKTAPTISAAAKKADGTTYAAGTWTNQSVTVQFTCADATSKIASCSPNQTFSADGVTNSVGGTAQDNADNSATASFGPVKLDKTRPTVIYSGNAGTYTADQTIAITCTAADSLSGVAFSTCKNISGPAYSFAVGTNSFSAQATDNAGNQGVGTTSFTLKVTSASLSTVIKQFVTDPSAAQSLIVKANEIATAPNAGAKANKLQAFISLVQAQTGKSITQAQADILIKLARGL